MNYKFFFVLITIILLGFGFLKYFAGYKKELLIAFSITIFSFLAPSIQYYLMLILNVFIVLIALPNFTFLIPLKGKTIQFFLVVLDAINVRTYFLSIYKERFSINTNIFNIQLAIIFAGGIFYATISQYLFLNFTYLSVKNPLLLLAIYFLLFLCLAINQYRFILSMSLFIATLSNKTIYLVDDLPLDIDKSPESSNQASSSNNKHYSIFTINKHYFNQPKNISRFKWVGIGLALCTVGIGGYAADQQRQQTEYQRQQTYHTAREADVAAVDSGLISKDEYYRRHPEDKPFSTPSKEK